MYLTASELPKNLSGFLCFRVDGILHVLEIVLEVPWGRLDNRNVRKRTCALKC